MRGNLHFLTLFENLITFTQDQYFSSQGDFFELGEVKEAQRKVFTFSIPGDQKLQITGNLI